MSLASRIIFVSSMMACAALCTWAALSFGEPAGPLMWSLTAICVVVSVVVWFIKAPAEPKLDSIRVEGAREPTYRLVRTEPGAKGEVWQLVLGNTQCKLIRPDGTPATTFARKWADTAIRLPGFVSGANLGIVTEEWSPPDEDGGITPDALFKAAKNIRRTSDRDNPHYWFAPSKELTEEIEEYQRRTLIELGPEAAGPLRIKARQFILTGGIGLVVGLGILAVGLANLTGHGNAPPRGRDRTLAIGGVLALIGLWRLGQGIVLYNKAGQVS